MAHPSEVFLATMFSGAGHASKDSGLLIASSTDGVTFRNIRSSSQPIYTPARGLRDPMIMYWRGHWYLVYSYGPNVSPLLFLAKSSDLLNWTPVSALQLAPERRTGDGGSIHNPGTANNFIDVPQWIVDAAGNVHLIACIDDNHHWVELHPLSSDPSTWGDQANWSKVTDITDCDGQPLVQGNSFVTLRDGVYFMALNAIEGGLYYLRRSTSLASGWSARRQLNLDHAVQNGDSENLVCLGDGRLRFYISNGNSLTNVMWCVDSADFAEWTAPKVLDFQGFGLEKINWAQLVRITDKAAIAAMVAEGQIS
jgi:hypothetical protein